MAAFRDESSKIVTERCGGSELEKRVENGIGNCGVGFPTNR